MTKPSDTRRVVLSEAGQQDALLVEPPTHLPAAARQSFLHSLMSGSLLEEGHAPRGYVGLAWRQDAGDLMLRIYAARCRVR